MSLRNPLLKMSKSHADEDSRILITDRPDQIGNKVLSALTDSTNSVSYDPQGRPGVANLLGLWSHFDIQGRTPARLGVDMAGRGLKDLKIAVADAIIEGLKGIRERYEEVIAEDDGAYILELERRGAAKARENAQATMDIVRQAVGL